MSVGAYMEWDVRIGGNDLNGGGWYRAATSGTNHAHPLTPLHAMTDLIPHPVSNGYCRSASVTAIPDHIGNVINITGGTGWGTGRCRISSIYTNAGYDWWNLNAYTTLPCTPASGSDGAGRLGGALATVREAQVDSTGGNIIHLQYHATPYSWTGAKLDGTEFMLLGYETTPWDTPRGSARPVIDLAGMTAGQDGYDCSGVTLVGWAIFKNARARALVDTSLVVEVDALDSLGTGIQGGGGHAHRCLSRGSGGDGFDVFHASQSWADQNALDGFQQTYSGYKLLSTRNTLDGFGGDLIRITLANCVSAFNGRHGFYGNTGPKNYVNDLAVQNGGYGFYLESSATYNWDLILEGCGGYLNTSGNFRQPSYLGLNSPLVNKLTAFLHLGGSPFVDATAVAGHDDYRLNSTYGALCKGVGVGNVVVEPDEDPVDIGLLQAAVAAARGGGIFTPIGLSGRLWRP